MDPRPSPQLRLSLLGDFRLQVDQEELATSSPARRLLAYLAVVHRDRPVARGALAERLWPEAPPGRAASSLRSVLWRLPRPRGRVLVVGAASTVRLSGDLQVDLWQAEQVAAQLCADGETAEETPPGDREVSIGPLTCDLLPHWSEDWLVVERESWRQQRLHALERCAGAWCDRGRYPQALHAGLGAVRSEPLRESAHRRVIEVHLAEGNHAEALRQYDGYRRLLAAELGIAPSPAIRKLVAPLLGRPADR